jgi:chromosome segregation protein
MLKRLQLVGFKSFADKTDFDFSPGLTAIVGPNGSGKSNIVDAVRWVMGEQSARSLRGAEMSDVIFNGSASRRSLGLAEVTLFFDNSRQTLAASGEEIQITRRVYRSGEGEYLINGQPSRLKDIKDLFLGSGAGTDAYSIIEQGRVDVLLQASTKERRTIFEEAAGISRFRARKTETLRKLERVDSNLLRLRDIMEEVEKQLRSIRLQAAKAQRYREHSARLKELRIGLGLRDYESLAGKLEAATAALETLRRSLQEETEEAGGQERALQDVELTLARLDETIREQEAKQAGLDRQIAADTATITLETDQSQRLSSDCERTSALVLEATRHAENARGSLDTAQEECTAVELARTAAAEELERLDQEFKTGQQLLADLQQKRESDRLAHLELMRVETDLKNDTFKYKTEWSNLTRERDRLRRNSDQAAEDLASLEGQLAEMNTAEEDAQSKLTDAREKLTTTRQERERLQQLRDETNRLATELRATQSGVASRIEVLDSLETRHEGMDTGVREVFTLLEQPDPGPWSTVLGIVADFLGVRREYAPLIDLALGEHAHHFVIRDVSRLRVALDQLPHPLSGRVSFCPITQPTSETPLRPNRLLEMSAVMRVRMPISAEGQPVHPGVIALAEQVVSCEAPELADLPHRLLGQTLIVRDLDTARALAAHTTGFRFVTLQGELLETDGTLTIGSPHAEGGILSRKSELRDLREQLAELDSRLAEIEIDLGDLFGQVSRVERETNDLTNMVDALAGEAATARSRLEEERRRRNGLHEVVQLNRQEMGTLEEEIQRLESAWQEAREQATRASEDLHTLQTRIKATDDAIQQTEHECRQQQEGCSEARVALAKISERVSATEKRVSERENVHADRESQLTQAQSDLHNLRQRLDRSNRSLLSASSSLAACTLEKETVERVLAGMSQERTHLSQQKKEWSEQVNARRERFQAQQEQVHERDVEVRALHHRLDSIVDRLHDDYQIDLAAVYKESRAQHADAPPTEFDPAATNAEIEELKTKLTRLGSVNMDALTELEDLEKRGEALQTQLDDLTAAKKTLEEIINRINTDSRRLFSDTLSVIRSHFQELFRKLFGGGQANIVLEDENDILETGIEIIARPPGKELRGISLMSGGEKTLTAVALLLAIFRSKPSPFCILDEVDAALDEANIGRLAAVLREFLDRSQFILITHSKRTMATADVLYGVTMQESGVSKRIAVRFEDWPDDERPPQDEQVA